MVGRRNQPLLYIHDDMKDQAKFQVSTDDWIEIRPALESDLPMIEDLARHTFSASYPDYDFYREEKYGPWYDPKNFCLVLEKKKSWCSVAVYDDKIISFIQLEIFPHDKKKSTRVGEVIGLFVHPRWQRVGIGTSMLSTGLEALRERGIQTILVRIHKDNKAALYFFERNGFKLVSVNVYKDDVRLRGVL